MFIILTFQYQNIFYVFVKRLEEFNFLFKILFVF